MSQKLMAANSIGTRVSLSPRNAPAAIPCTPSVTKKLAPMSSSVAASSAVVGVRRSVAAEEKQRNDVAERDDDHGRREQEQRAQRDRDKARPPRRNAIAAAERVSDAHGGGERNAERNHEQDRRDLQCDLMRGQRGRADPAHQQRGRREQPPFQHEGA